MSAAEQGVAADALRWASHAAELNRHASTGGWPMSVIRHVLVTGFATLTACQDSTGPVTPDYTGTRVADSIVCWTTFDTYAEIVF